MLNWQCCANPLQRGHMVNRGCRSVLALQRRRVPGRGGDDGVHRIVADPEGETAKAFQTIVDNTLEQLDSGSERKLKII